MQNKKLIYSFLVVLSILALILAGIIFYSKDQSLKVIFLDVGQGDAILIEQGSQQILIDGGPSGQALLNKIGRYIPFWDREIEMVIATHPDADHITGLVDVIKNYQVDTVMQTETPSDSQVFQKLQEVIRQKNIAIVKGERGVKINLAEGAQMEILSPGSETSLGAQDTNASSIVAKLAFGENSFLLTGDLPGEQEEGLLKSGLNFKAQILKVAHHGSKYSTTNEFLDAVKPQEAIISVGKNNRYGHPNPEALDRLKSKNIKAWRTDEMGDIIYKCLNSGTKCQLVAN
ncbi:MAG: ComEC/Rec2 family competence protein [Parcubacteria group bacterium]|jgi:competence protein ComEC